MENGRMAQLGDVVRQCWSLTLGFCGCALRIVALLLAVMPFASAQQNLTSGGTAPLPGVVAQWDFHLGPSHASCGRILIATILFTWGEARALRLRSP